MSVDTAAGGIVILIDPAANGGTAVIECAALPGVVALLREPLVSQTTLLLGTALVHGAGALQCPCEQSPVRRLLGDWLIFSNIECRTGDRVLQERGRGRASSARVQ